MDIVLEITSAYTSAFTPSLFLFTGAFLFISVLALPIWLLKKL